MGSAGGFAENLTASVEGAREAMLDLEDVAQRFGNTVTGVFSRAVVNGKQFDDVVRTLGTRLTQLALQAALKPLETAVTSGLGSLLDKGVSAGIGSLGTALSGNLLTASAAGNVVAGGAVRPFADGGVIAAPTYFPLGRGTGLMGEKGAEAIMPLTRGPDGKLGVQAAGGGASTVNVTINASDVESFRRSEAQVAAALARAVARGRRGL
ncbi:phage tail tape measure protein [Pseudochelatococcus lubricantis]|uniref:phage tail tape measure protein n=1 Tax=Pseudochelatococcus lubricantis TaxID=1538102 RepID=UPI0035ECB467